MSTIRLLDIRQPALYLLSDPQNRLKIHLPTLFMRDFAAAAAGALFLTAIIRLTSAPNYSFFALPGVAAAGVIGWNHYELKRTQEAVKKRAVELFVTEKVFAQDVKEYLDTSHRGWHEVSKHPGKIADKLIDYCREAVNEGRFDVVEELLERKLVPFEKVDLSRVDKERQNRWLFNYLDLNGAAESLMRGLWDTVFRTKGEVTKTPVFKKLVANFSAMSVEVRSMIFLQAITEKRTDILEILRKSGAQFNELFIYLTCNVIETMQLDDFIKLTKYLTPHSSISYELWKKICGFNFINEELYRLYSQSIPSTNPDLIGWDLTRAVEKGCDQVLNFFLENKKIQVTNAMAHKWWVTVSDGLTLNVLKFHKVDPNATNPQGETPLMGVIKRDAGSYKDFLSQRDHVKALLDAGAIGKTDLFEGN